MMNKEEMILAIRAYDAIKRLDDLIVSLTESQGLSGTRFDDVYCLGELIYMNCGFYEPESDEKFARFVKIVSEQGMTVEERYKRMIKKVESKGRFIE